MLPTYNVWQALFIGKNRLREAQQISDKFCTLCPFCIFNFNEANDEKIEIISLYREISEFLGENIEKL